jgi:hypothetical protein
LPFDIGALHAVKRRYRDRTFTCFPNIVIQDGTDSEIGTSTIFFREARKEVNLYRWRISDYGLDAIRAQRTRRKATGARTKHGRSTSFTFDRFGRVRAWLRERRAALAFQLSGARPTTTSLPPALSPPTPSFSRDRWSGQRELPLVPFPEQQSNVGVVLVLAIGINGDDLPRLLDMVATKSREDDVVPIIVTDYMDFVAFRDKGIIFEYLPDDAQRQAHAADLDWKLYELRRLALLRRKWRPINTIAFGASGTRVLREWQASPLWEGGPKIGQ